jgi:hypothetical protein
MIAAGTVALIVGLLSFANPLQGLITAISSFFLLLLIVLGSIWAFRVARWPARRQHVFIWAVALGGGLIIVLFPFGLARILS